MEDKYDGRVVQIQAVVTNLNPFPGIHLFALTDDGRIFKRINDGAWTGLAKIQDRKKNDE